MYLFLPKVFVAARASPSVPSGFNSWRTFLPCSSLRTTIWVFSPSTERFKTLPSAFLASGFASTGFSSGLFLGFSSGFVSTGLPKSPEILLQDSSLKEKEPSWVIKFELQLDFLSIVEVSFPPEKILAFGSFGFALLCWFMFCCSLSISLTTCCQTETSIFLHSSLLKPNFEATACVRPCFLPIWISTII